MPLGPLLHATPAPSPCISMTFCKALHLSPYRCCCVPHLQHICPALDHLSPRHQGYCPSPSSPPSSPPPAPARRRFITFDDESSVERVFTAGSMQELGGKKVEVKAATPKGSGPQGPSRFSGRGAFPAAAAAGRGFPGGRAFPAEYGQMGFGVPGYLPPGGRRCAGVDGWWCGAACRAAVVMSMNLRCCW